MAGCSKMNGRTNNMCGCDHRALMRKVQELDFSMIETGLYLDSYPDCREALDYFGKLSAFREAAVREYEDKVGPLTVYGNGKDSWRWISAPWPWQYEGN